MNKGKMLLSVERTLGRSLIVLCVAGIIAGLLYGLSRSVLAPDWARAMNVSGPLIVLNTLVQGAFDQVNRGRDSISLARGLLQLARFLVVLGGVVIAVVLTRAFAQRRGKT
jgi:hypothetical protein